jgi:hypothetical protein
MRVGAVVGALLVAMVLGCGGGGSWRVVTTKSASGRNFSGVTVSATIPQPAGLAAKLDGQVYHGSALVSCSVRRPKPYIHSGFYRLPMIRHAKKCRVLVVVQGFGRITAAIESR